MSVNDGDAVMEAWSTVEPRALLRRLETGRERVVSLGYDPRPRAL
jgi:hypothetical protein